MTKANNINLVSKYCITGSEIPIVIRSLPAYGLQI